MESDNRIIKSYVWHKEKCFFVSTIERDSSAMEGPRRFNETIVWEFDWGKNERGNMVFQDEDSTGSIRTHSRICEKLFREGVLNYE